MFTRFERRIPRRTRAALLLAIGLIVACVSYALLAAGIGSASASGPVGSAPARAAAPAPGPGVEGKGQLTLALGVSALRETPPQPAAAPTLEAGAWIEPAFPRATRSAAPPSVPEPGSALLLGAGLIALALRPREQGGRRSRRTRSEL